jgi:hypothetical protein
MKSARKTIQKKGHLLLTLLLVSALTVAAAHPAQSDTLRFSDWSEPVNLGPVINSPFSDRHPAISKNGLSLYLTSNRPGGYGGDDIWVSHRARVGDPWGPPQNVGPNINTGATEYAPTFSRDGHWILFISTRAGGYGGEDIWASYREHTHDDFDWQPAVNLGAMINSAYDDGGPTLFEDDETGEVILYFASNRPGGPGDFDIYTSTMDPDGSFGPPALVTELNSPGRDTRTAIRHDGLEVFITSNRAETVGGLDLWVSTRATTLDAWSVPVNLGPFVNSTFNDGAPALSSDGETLFFYSNRPGGLGGNNLYMSTRTRVRGRQ